MILTTILETICRLTIFRGKHRLKKRKQTLKNDALSVQEKLHEWAVTFQITQETVGSLLGALRRIIETLP